MMILHMICTPESIILRTSEYMILRVLYKCIHLPALPPAILLRGKRFVREWTPQKKTWYCRVEDIGRRLVGGYGWWGVPIRERERGGIPHGKCMCELIVGWRIGESDIFITLRFYVQQQQQYTDRETSYVVLSGIIMLYRMPWTVCHSRVS